MSCTPPKLNGHRTLFKGKRFYVFEVSTECPFEGYEAEADVVVFDKLYGDVVATCDRNLNCDVTVGFGPMSVPVYGANPKRLVLEVKKALKTLEQLMR